MSELSNDKRRFVGSVKPNWCPGCGDYGLLSATTKVLAEEGYQPHEVVIVSGIGCSSSFPHWTTAYGMHVLHGRALPAATGVHLANPDLKVVVVGGDGDGYGIGVGHFVHAARRNLDVTYMVMNNQIYGLTIGQPSPSTSFGHKTRITPKGVDEHPLNPIALSMSAGASFVARGFSGNGKQLRSIIQEALNHEGFSFVDVLSPCVTFNKVNTYDWFKERIYDLQQVDHDRENLGLAFQRAIEWGKKIPTGIFYQQPESIPLHMRSEATANEIPAYQDLGFPHLKLDSEVIFDEFR